MASLLEVSTPTPDGDHYRWDVPEGWNQGRGAYGGLTIGALVRAIEHRVGDPARTVRTVTAELPAPVLAGACMIQVDVLRSGNSLTVARAALVQGGETRGHVVAVLAASRPNVHATLTGWRHLTAPEVPPWKQLPVAPTAQGGAPPFVHHFELRVVEGLPLSGGAPHTLGWVRPRLPCVTQDAGYIASLCDVWWPGVLVHLTAPRPLATIAYTLEIVDGLVGLDPDAPLLYRGTVPVLADGYFLETRELWGEDGRLVARNHQTFAVIA